MMRKARHGRRQSPMRMRLLLPPLLAGALLSCRSVDPGLVQQPESVALYRSSAEELEKLGETLWQETSLSRSGALACQSCHREFQAFQPSFTLPYPHNVKMVESKLHLQEISAAGMVQFCMIMPMEKEPLPWDSKELAALTAYVLKLQKEFQER